MHMSDRPLFADVDALAGQQGVAQHLNAALECQRVQQALGLGVDQALRQVGEHAGSVKTEMFRAPRAIAGKRLSQVEGCGASEALREMALQQRPCGRLVATRPVSPIHL